MRSCVLAPGLVLLIALSAAGASPGVASATAQSRACAVKADAQGLRGGARQDFEKVCIRGVRDPAVPLQTESRMGSAGAVTRPSGADPTTRSHQCNTEADKRGLTDSAREAFRLRCLATAAPAGTIGTSTTSPIPTASKDELGQLPR